MSRDPVIPEAYTVFFLYILLLLSCRSHIDVVTSPAPPEGVRVGGGGGGGVGVVTPLYMPYMFAAPKGCAVLVGL